MNIERVVFGFFIVMALSLNFAFVLGDIDNPDHHNAYIMFAALFVNVIATILKLGERSHLGALLLATGIAACILLLMAVGVWAVAVYAMELGLIPAIMVSIVSLSAGALLANVISVILVVIETSSQQRLA